MLNLPKLVRASDYHDFWFMQDTLNQIGLKLKVWILGLEEGTGQYVGVVYSGRRPAKMKIEALLSKKKIELTA